MKHKTTDRQLRDIVRMRLTKGDAFRLPLNSQYLAEQARVRAILAGMPRADIFHKYPTHTSDLKP